MGLLRRSTTLLFALARVMMAQPQWPANSQASLQLFKTNLFGMLFSLCYALLKFERFCSCKSFSNAKWLKRCTKSRLVKMYTSAKKTAWLKSCIKEDVSNPGEKKMLSCRFM